MLTHLRRFAFPILFVVAGVILYSQIPTREAGEAGSPAVTETVTPTTASAPLAPPGFPSDIITAIRGCLNAPDEIEPSLGETPAPEKVKILGLDEALAEIEKELGPALVQGDQWTDWIVRLPEGHDRRVHLELVQDDAGRTQQNLSVFQMDQSGQATKMSIPDSDERNPGMSVISNYLNAGEVLRKETSRFFEYADGERLELVESDGQPSEVEVVKGDIFFRCDDLKMPENCTCIR